MDQTTKQVLDRIPSVLPRPNGQPWITRNIVRKLRKLKRLYDKTNNFPSIKHQKEHDDYVREVNRDISQAKADYIKNHLTKTMEEGNSKPLYNYLKKHTGRSNNIAGLKNTDCDNIPNALADHFAKVYEHKDLPQPTFDVPAYPAMEPLKLTKTGIENLINKLDIRKAYGPDNISSMVLKMFTNNVPSFLDCVVKLLTISIETSCLPLVWKKAIVSPIFKGGDRSDVNNYRPISLTCILCKLLEHVICSRMWCHINDYGIIKENQHGFRKSLNTTTQLLHVTHRAAEALDRKRDYHIVSFDFTKAFARVPHDLYLFTNCVNTILISLVLCGLRTGSRTESRWFPQTDIFPKSLRSVPVYRKALCLGHCSFCYTLMISIPVLVIQTVVSMQMTPFCHVMSLMINRCFKKMLTFSTNGLVIGECPSTLENVYMFKWVNPPQT